MSIKNIPVVIQIAFLALLWLIVVNPGSIAGDTMRGLQRTHAWLFGGEEVQASKSHVPPDHPLSRFFQYSGVAGKNGKRYLADDMGHSVLMMPGDWIATKFHRFFPGQDEKFFRCFIVSFIVFVPIGVLTVISCYWLLRLFGFTEKPAGVSAILWLLATTVFHYLHAHQRNGIVLLLVLLSYACVLACVLRNKPYLSFLSGLCAGFAILVRQDSVIYVGTVFLFLSGCLLLNRKNRVDIIKMLAWWTAGIVPMIAIGRIFDFIRFGSFWDTGATLGFRQLQTDPALAGLPPLPAGWPFNKPAWIGIWGVLFSPAKSIFIYDPLLLPCMILTGLIWKKLSGYVRLYLVVTMLNLALFTLALCKLDFWGGDASWGGRYHITSLHLIFVPLVALFLDRLLSEKGVMRKIMVGIAGLSIAVQFSSVIFRPSTETGRIYFTTAATFSNFRLGERMANIASVITAADKAKTPDAYGETLYDKLNLWPFSATKSRKLFFAIWFTMLIMAVIVTVQFIRCSLSNAKGFNGGYHS